MGVTCNEKTNAGVIKKKNEHWLISKQNGVLEK